MIVRALGPVSCTTGIAFDLDFSTISIGFSRTVSIGLIDLIWELWLSAVRGRSLSVAVISASGALCSWDGSGDIEGCGVGNGGGKSGAGVVRDVRVGALFRLRGDARLDGDSGSGWTDCSGSNSSVGSIFSLLSVFLDLPDVLGVVAIELVVFRLDCVCLRGLFCGAGVKSSSLSSSTFCMLCISSSSSDDSTTTFRRVAARLDGLVGDSVDILLVGVFVYCLKLPIIAVINVTWRVFRGIKSSSLTLTRQIFLKYASSQCAGTQSRGCCLVCWLLLVRLMLCDMKTKPY
jgi:hypothetical protein